MSVSSSLRQWGVCPGMTTTSPLVMRLDTPPSIPEPRTLAARRLLRIGQGAARHQRGHSLHHVVDLGGVHLVQIRAAGNILRTEHAVDTDPVVARDLDHANRPVADPGPAGVR